MTQGMGIWNRVEKVEKMPSLYSYAFDMLHDLMCLWLSNFPKFLISLWMILSTQRLPELRIEGSELFSLSPSVTDNAFLLAVLHPESLQQFQKFYVSLMMMIDFLSIYLSTFARLSPHKDGVKSKSTTTKNWTRRQNRQRSCHSSTTPFYSTPLKITSRQFWEKSTWVWK